MTDLKENKEELEELIKCSRCHCFKKKSLYRIRTNTGRFLKTCINCREKFKCDVDDCNYSCSDNSNLQKHIKQVHTRIKDFECDVDDCNYSCSNNSDLQKHIKSIHTQIKDIQCNFCDYKCSQNSNLQTHIKQVHTKIKDFICNIEGCNMKFVRNSNLQIHIKAVHTKIKNLKCDIEYCDYKCSDNSNLQQHIKGVHTKIKDFVCDFCNYKCSFKGDLQRHIKAVHNNIKDFECDIDGCNFKCSSKSYLNHHIKICTGSRKISSGEFEVINNLEKLGLYEDIDYIHNSTFIELTNYCDRNLRFDFRLINHKIIIEFDGIQHFEPQAFGGISKEQALSNFQDQKESDNIKDEFCKKFDYKMIRISYKQFPEILSILHSELLDIVELD
jgi:uncharacterized Zn-finger protein